MADMEDKVNRLLAARGISPDALTDAERQELAHELETEVVE